MSIYLKEKKIRMKYKKYVNWNFSKHLLVLCLTLNNLFLYCQSSIYISSDNKVGIGTENPAAKLDVLGDVNITGDLMVNGMVGDSGSVLFNFGSNGLQWVNSFRQGIWNLIDSNAVFKVGDVLIDKTFINNAHYIDGVGTIFNKWLPNIEGDNYQPPFFFTGARFPNIGFEDNYVYNFGSNLGYGGGAYEQGTAAYGIGFENKFYINNKPYNEFHILAVDNTGIQRRPLYSLFSHDGSQLEMINQLSGLSLHDKDNTKQLYRIDTNGEIMSYNGQGFRHIFNTSNYSPIWQKNHLGSVCPLIGIKDNNILLSADTLNCTLKLGSTLTFGFKNDTTQVIKPLFSNCVLELGDSSQGYKQINLNSSNSNILQLSNNFTGNPLKFNIDSSGNFLLHKGLNNNYILKVHDSIFGNGFEIFSNGNVTLGDSVSGSYKLNVGGSVQVTGDLVFVNSEAEYGQVLTFNGTGVPMTFETIIKKRYEYFFIAEQNQSTFILSDSIPAVNNYEIPIEVFLNGIKMKYTSGNVIGRRFSYQGNQIFLPSLNEGDEIEIVYFK